MFQSSAEREKRGGGRVCLEESSSFRASFNSLELVCPGVRPRPMGSVSHVGGGGYLPFLGTFDLGFSPLCLFVIFLIATECPTEAGLSAEFVCVLP